MTKIVKLSKKGGLISKTTMQNLIIEGFNEEAIIKCCKGEVKTHKGHKFKFDDGIDVAPLKEKPEVKKVEKVEKIELDEIPFGEGKIEELAADYIPFILEDNTFIKTTEAAIFLEETTGKKPGPNKIHNFMVQILKTMRLMAEGE